MLKNALLKAAMEHEIRELEKPLKSESFSIDGINFEINLQNQASVDYVNRTIMMSEPKPSTTSNLQTVVIDGATWAEGSKIVNQHIKESNSVNGNEIGMLIDGSHFIRNNYYVHISKQLTDNSWYHISAGNEPEMGVCSFIRTHLLRKSSLELEHFTVLHAAAITDILTGESIIIMGDNDNFDARNKGKTSLSMYACFHENSRFALSSDNEVIFGVLGDVSTFKSIPNEILMRERLYQELQRQGKHFNLETWTGVDKKNGEKIYTTSAGYLSEVGIKFSPIKRVSNVIFVSLDPSLKSIDTHTISWVEAEKKAENSVHPMRMKQVAQPIWLNETGIERVRNVQATQEVSITWNKLDRKVGLWKMSGTIDPSGLYQSLCDIIKK